MRTFLALLALTAPALADGPQGQKWLDLKSENGLVCCDHHDGEDVYWDKNPMDPSQFRAFVNGQFIPVPPGAMVNDPNWYGQAVVWLQAKVYTDGKLTSFEIRCFWPGSSY